MKKFDYKTAFKAFFKFYQDFDFSLVLSPYDGRAYTMQEYQQLYPSFKVKALSIAGPINRASNCGAHEPYVKNHFLEICKASTKFFRQPLVNQRAIPVSVDSSTDHFKKLIKTNEKLSS